MNKIEKAVLFATKAHAGAFRKGTNRPYILHPIEAMSIVMKFTEDEDVVAAAVLHDTLEDTSVTREQLEIEFGSRVATLVASVSEDKKKDRPAEKTWKERKQETIQQLKIADLDVKLLCLGDKLSNLRDMEEDYADIGEDLWKRFNQKDKRLHEWYYREIYKILAKEKIFDNRYEMAEFSGDLDFIFEDPDWDYIKQNESIQDQGGTQHDE